ncbi:MAG: ABC transporter ATP-binding protein [Clostridia bacterium]
MEKLLKFVDVSLTYQTPKSEVFALDNVSFEVGKGEFVAIVGPSGCGKTTILSLIAGLILPSNGQILIEGKTLEKNSNIGYMFQHDHLFEWRTIWQNIMLGLEVKGMANNKDEIQRMSTMLNKYGLGEFKKNKPSQMSGGMRQRAALLRTLAIKPQLLLLDEPFSALDFQTRLAVCDNVYQIITEEKQTVVLVTHDISEAISMADRIIILTSRPAKIKNILQVKLKKYGLPLKRRESPEFHMLFEKILKELEENEETKV